MDALDITLLVALGIASGELARRIAKRKKWGLIVACALSYFINVAVLVVVYLVHHLIYGH